MPRVWFVQKLPQVKGKIKRQSGVDDYYIQHERAY
jgi:hypothetical protein